MPCTDSDYHRFNLHRLTGALENGYSEQLPSEEKDPKQSIANGGSIASEESPTDELQNLIHKGPKMEDNVSIFGGVCISGNIRLNELTTVRDLILLRGKMRLRW